MSFGVNIAQSFLFGSSVFAALTSLKNTYTSCKSFTSCLLGTDSLTQRITSLSHRAFIGSDSLKERRDLLKKSVYAMVDALIYGTAAFLAYKGFQQDFPKEKVDTALEDFETIWNQSEELALHTLPSIESWEDTICHNEALQWETAPLLHSCLTHTAQKKEALPPVNSSFAPLDKCYDILNVLEGVAFYKIDLKRKELEQVEEVLLQRSL